MAYSSRFAFRAVPLLMAAVTLAGVLALLLWDVRPQIFTPNAHAMLGAFPLAMIAFAWLAHNSAQRASFRDWMKAVLLAAAFLFWAANQYVQSPHAAIVCNDIAIALFILDLFFVIVSSPATL